MPALVSTLLREDLNFLITNRIPRRLVTRLAAWISRVESPFLTRVGIRVWSWCSGSLHLEEAETTQFDSLHACFTRRLRADARRIDHSTDVAVSPCDAIVGAAGLIADDVLVQAKGLTYTLQDLLHDRSMAKRFSGGHFITLRLTASMYHRFHAPCAARLRRVQYISGDTWNVNPIALKRVERLFCRNERAVIELELPDTRECLVLVPVAAILVAGIRLHALPVPFNLTYRGRTAIDCNVHVTKGEELGYFENGSTIIVLASRGFTLCPTVVGGERINMGQALLQCSNPETPPAATPAHSTGP